MNSGCPCDPGSLKAKNPNYDTRSSPTNALSVYLLRGKGRVRFVKIDGTCNQKPHWAPLFDGLRQIRPNPTKWTHSLPLIRPSRACGFAQWSSRSCQVFPIIEIVAVATSKPFAPAHAAQVEFFRPVNQNYWPRRLVRDAPVKPN